MTTQTSLEARPQRKRIQAPRFARGHEPMHYQQPVAQTTNTRVSSRDSVTRMQPSRQTLSPSPAGSEPEHRPMNSGFPIAEAPHESRRRSRSRSGDFSLTRPAGAEAFARPSRARSKISRRQVSREPAVRLDALPLAGLASDRVTSAAQEMNGPTNREILTGITLALVIFSFLFVASMAA